MSTEDTSDLKRFEDADRYMQRCDDCPYCFDEFIK